jgi:hypothetical protein
MRRLSSDCGAFGFFVLFCVSRCAEIARGRVQIFVLGTMKAPQGMALPGFR